MHRFSKGYLLVALSALLLSISRLPLYTGWLVFIAFVPFLFWMQKGAKPLKELIFSALIYSFIQIAIVFYWIGTVTFVGLIGIWLLYSLYYLLSFYMLSTIWHKKSRFAFLGFSCVFISFEYLQNFGEMRFPWWNIGYSLADYDQLLQALDLGGLSLLALLILSLNYLFYKAIISPKRCLCIAFIPAILLIWQGYGFFRIRTLPLEEKDAKVAVMQPCIEQVEKWDEAKYDEIMDKYDELSQEAKAEGFELMIYPEAAIPDYIFLSIKTLNDVNYLVQKNDISIFAGFPHATKAPEEHPEPYYYYNAASLFSPLAAKHVLYYKNILVPVGERMLFLSLFPALWKLQFGQANWEFGQSIPRYHHKGYSFAPSICYELAFPHFMLKANLKDEQGRPKKADFHANLTNDAWFGTSYGPWLHGMMTKFRAIESRIQIYRSANTGISMIVDPKGKVLSKAELFEFKNISAPLYTTAVIPLYPRIQYYPFIFVFGAIILFIYSILGRS